ncbi:MAG TPA: type II and III secretion system protein family protein [Candidatus Sulfotelmatobacter sp.]|nr:type II and III secretion system protein family protein [Candidatus Sulfotelmatobacter sp.]
MNGTSLDFPQRTISFNSGFPRRGKHALLAVGVALIAAAMLLPFRAFSELQQSTPATDPAQNTTAPTGTQTANLPPQSEQPQGSAPLRVMVGKSLLINTTERLKRISVTDPTIAYAQVITPTQILVHGHTPGEVSLLIWDELERSRSFDLRVDVDVSACTEEEHRVFPEEQIAVTPSRAAIVLSGHVSTEDVAKRAGELASAYSPKVINVLTFGPVGAQEVLLQVKFAEVDRSALTQLGVNLISTGAANTVGTTTTGQYGGVGPQTITQNVGQSAPFSANASLSNVLNLFLFRPDIHFGAVIQALETSNLLQILSEPNLIAVNGKEASFLAGGQFPFPIVQPGAGFTAVTISFKEFGVKLVFTPVIMPNGNIHLKVAPEVSTLDFSNALTISGFTVPALSTRKAETEFELQDGQSFVIAGLMDNRVTDVYNKIPGLGDIPILGAFFRSKSLQKNNSELMVLCTVHRVSPSTETPTLPKDPKPFIDNSKFDKPLGK